MSKRKRDEDEDEDVLPGYQVLPVANLPEDFNDVPLDGMQYLFTVRRDARHLPMVTRVVNPYEQPRQPTPPTNSEYPPPHPDLPSEEWRLSFQRHYSNLRKNLDQPTMNPQFNVQDPRQKIMPDKKERDLWWAFLAGRPEVDWTKKPKVVVAKPQNRRDSGRGMRGYADSLPYDQSSNQDAPQMNDEGEVERALTIDPSESLPTPSGSPAPQEFGHGESSAAPVAYTPREPTTTLLRQIDHRMALHLLMYFTHWINLHVEQTSSPTSYLTETHARWIFSLLTRVEDFASADDTSLLRNLARACIALLQKKIRTRGTAVEVGRDAFGERSCWITITVVVGVWAQRDLWMEAEEMLVKG